MNMMVIEKSQLNHLMYFKYCCNTVGDANPATAVTAANVRWG